jgi:subtilisin-like proprotein convertase family protein
MWGRYSAAVTSAIPDGSSTGVTRTIQVGGLASVDQDVVVKVELTHPAPAQLAITLTNPDNNQVAVWSHEAAAGPSLVVWRAPWGFSGDESVNGTWTLHVVDDVAGQAGTLDRWSLEITSRWD